MTERSWHLVLPKEHCVCLRSTSPTQAWLFAHCQQVTKPNLGTEGQGRWVNKKLRLTAQSILLAGTRCGGQKPRKSEGESVDTNCPQSCYHCPLLLPLPTPAPTDMIPAAQPVPIPEKASWDEGRGFKTEQLRHTGEVALRPATFSCSGVRSPTAGHILVYILITHEIMEVKARQRVFT